MTRRQCSPSPGGTGRAADCAGSRSRRDGNGRHRSRWPWGVSARSTTSRTAWGVPPIDPASLSLYLELHYLPAPHALLARTGQVEPGELLVVADGRIASRRRWWSLPPATQSETGAAAVDHVESVLVAAVAEQLVADRPVGTFLSGGVDSALVTSLAEDRTGGHLQSFTVSFPGTDTDEGPAASGLSKEIGVEHHVIRLDEAGAEAALDDAVAAGAEPMGDFSIVPTTLLAGFASEHVTVALSGDGGDELFYGYVRPYRCCAAVAGSGRHEPFDGPATTRVASPRSRSSEVITARTPGALTEA